MKYLGLQNYTSKCKPTNGHLKLQKQKYAKDMQKESWATGMYGKVSKILKPCQTFKFKDESSPQSTSSNMQIHLSLKNSRNIFTALEMMYTCICTSMCLMQLLVDFNRFDFLGIAT